VLNSAWSEISALEFLQHHFAEMGHRDLLILPVLTSVIGAVLQLIMLLVSSAVLLGSGLSSAALWTRLPWLRDVAAALLSHSHSPWALACTSLWLAPAVIGMGAM
jgi:hypothetical protein